MKFKKTEKYNSMGFSMMEILVSMIVLALVLVGFSSVFVFSEKYLQLSAKEDLAMEYASDTLDSLKNSVDQSTWPTAGSELKIGTHADPLPVTSELSDLGGLRIYTVYPIPGMDIRRVDLRVEWDEH